VDLCANKRGKDARHGWKRQLSSEGRAGGRERGGQRPAVCRRLATKKTEKKSLYGRKRRLGPKGRGLKKGAAHSGPLPLRLNEENGGLPNGKGGGGGGIGKRKNDGPSSINRSQGARKIREGLDGTQCAKRRKIRHRYNHHKRALGDHRRIASLTKEVKDATDLGRGQKPGAQGTCGGKTMQFAAAGNKENILHHRLLHTGSS